MAINYTTKGNGMLYSFNGKEYTITHDYFKVISSSVDDDESKIKIQIQNESIMTIIYPFYDSNIDLEDGDVIKVAYIIGDNGELRCHGYELANDHEVNITKTVKMNLNSELVDIDKYRDAFNHFIELIQNNDLKQLVKDMIIQVQDKFYIWPAAVSVHHNIPGGLLYHSYNVAINAWNIAVHYSDIDRDLVVAGALIHDIGKCYEYTEDSKLSSMGQFSDHITIVCSLLDSLYKTGKYKLTESLYNHLRHILISHHGKTEWGSPRTPATQEAMVVHLADYIDTQMYIYHQGLKEIPLGNTKYNKYTGNNLISTKINMSDTYIN